jgi:tetratricopeptide (TPR) repeat protein
MTHQGSVLAVAFSPDGKSLLTGSADHTARLWDAATGHPIGQPMKHQGSVGTVAFSPVVKLILSVGGNTARLWKVPIVEGDVRRLVNWIDVVTGEVLVPSGAILKMDAQTWYRRRRQLEELGGAPDEKVAPGQQREFLDRQVSEESERAGLWFAAAWHLDRLIISNPTDGSLYVRRGQAHAELGQWNKVVDDYSKVIALGADGWDTWFRRGQAYTALRQSNSAIADYTKAITLEPDHPEPWLWRGEVFFGLRQWDTAIADYTKVIELAPNEREAWVGRGDAHAQLGQWDQADADLTKAIELYPEAIELNPHWSEPHFLQADVRLAAGDIEGYRRACGTLLKAFGETREPENANAVARTIVLAPDALPDFNLVVKLAEKAVAQAPGNFDYLRTLGAVLYRARRFDAAVEKLTETAKNPGPSGEVSNAYNWLFLAMVHHRLGHADEARQWLDKAVERIDRLGHETTGEAADVPRLSWRERTTLDRLRREAEALVQGAAGDTK